MIPSGCKKVQWVWTPPTPNAVILTRTKTYRLSAEQAAMGAGITVSEWEDIEAGRREFSWKEWNAFCDLTDRLNDEMMVFADGPGRPPFEPKEMYLEAQICFAKGKKDFVSVGNRFSRYREFMAMNWPWDPSPTMDRGDELWVVCTDDGEWGKRDAEGNVLKWIPPSGQPMSRAIGILRGDRLRDLPRFQPSIMIPDFDMERPGISSGGSYVADGK